MRVYVLTNRDTCTCVENSHPSIEFNNGES